MKYKLICLDVDGTLLDDEKKIPTAVKKSLRKAHEIGVQIALVTGRLPAGAEIVEKELAFPCIKACSAGTYILLGDECIHMDYLLPSVMQKIYQEFAVKNSLPLWIFRGRKWYVTDVDSYVEQEIKIIHYKPEIVNVDRLARQWEEEGAGPNKLLIGADPQTISRILKEMEEMGLPQIDMARSADTYLEIFPKGVTKGEAMISICEKLDISLEETIAFGDQELDIPMIEKAGMGVAMGNAIEELKELADFVTKTNNDGGIAWVLEHYLTEE